MIKMHTLLLLLLVSSFFVCVYLENVVEEATLFDPACIDNISSKYTQADIIEEKDIGCICGIFLSGQFTKGTRENNNQPKGNAVVRYDHPEKFPCTPVGNKLCMNKCIEMIVKNLRNAATFICGSIERDCFREKAYLFFKNCKNNWINTNLSSGHEFCCKNNQPYKCPKKSR